MVMDIRRFVGYLSYILLCVCSQWAIAFAPGGAENSLVITQSVTGPTEGVVSSVAARRGSSKANGTALTMDIGATKLDTTSGVPQLAVTDYGTAMTRSQISTQAKLLMVGSNYPSAPGAVSPLTTSLQSYMAANNVSLVTFNFNQKIFVAGDTAPKYLVWSLIMRSGQRPSFPNPKIVDTLPTILQVNYIPKNVTKGLPAAWSYPNAGMLQWRKLDATYNPISAWTTVDVNGAYDEPEDLTGAAVDKDWGIKCLAKRGALPTCPSAVNVSDLMDQVGAGYALLDYGRMLQPVYDDVETPPGSGQFVQVARAAVSVDVRELNLSSCSNGTFRNQGTYGFELNNRVDRYGIWDDGRYKLLNSFQSKTLSATTPFNVSKIGVAGASVASLNDKVVNPSDPTGALLIAGSIPNLLNLAPITVVSAAQPTRAIGSYYYGSCGRSFGVEAQCDANGNVLLKFGVSAEVAGCAFGTNFYQEQNYTLTQGTPTDWQLSRLDYAGNFIWRYDGDHSIVFQRVNTVTPSAYLAPPGLSIFSSQLFYPNQGYVVNQNFPTGGPLDFYFEKGTCPGGSVGGEQIFAVNTDGYADLAMQCFTPDPTGTYSGCSMATGGVCSSYSAIGQKSWVPAQQ